MVPAAALAHDKVERVIRILNEQCVDRQRIGSIRPATRAIGDWLRFYNYKRPHQARAMKPPPGHSN